MKRSRFTDADKIRIIEAYRGGRTIASLCEEACISVSTFYAWRLRLGCTSRSELTSLERLRKENRRLRQKILDLDYETDRLKGILRIQRVKSNCDGSIESNEIGTSVKRAC